MENANGRRTHSASQHRTAGSQQMQQSQQPRIKGKQTPARCTNAVWPQLVAAVQRWQLHTW
jgi:hypothetical protein